LNACSHKAVAKDYCLIFPQIPKLTTEQQLSLLKGSVPDAFIKAVGDYKEIRNTVCKD